MNLWKFLKMREIEKSLSEEDLKILKIYNIIFRDSIM